MPIQIFLLDLLDFLKSGDRQYSVHNTVCTSQYAFHSIHFTSTSTLASRAATNWDWDIGRSVGWSTQLRPDLPGQPRTAQQPSSWHSLQPKKTQYFPFHLVVRLFDCFSQSLSLFFQAITALAALSGCSDSLQLLSLLTNLLPGAPIPSHPIPSHPKYDWICPKLYGFILNMPGFAANTTEFFLNRTF